MRSPFSLVCRLVNQGDNPNNWQLARRIIPGRAGVAVVFDRSDPQRPSLIHSVPFGTGTGTFWANSFDVARSRALSDPKLVARAQTDPGAIQVGAVKAMPSQAVDATTAPQWLLDMLAEDDAGVTCFVGIGN